MNGFLKHYGATLALLAGISVGALCGVLWPEAAHAVKPVGTLFLNLIFVMIVPLVFFSTASSICKLRGSGMLGRTVLTILAVFLGMSLVAAVIGLAGTSGFALVVPSEWHPASGAFADGASLGSVAVADAIVGALTAPDFSLLLSKEHMLALVLFSALFGYAVGAAGEQGRAMEGFVLSGTAVMMKMVSLVMVLAPLGLGCYFADTVASVGAQLLGGYLRVLLLYLGLTVVVFFVVNSLYVFAVGGSAASGKGLQARLSALRRYWSQIWAPAATAVGTASSAAAMPSAMESARRMGVRPEIAESVIPLGTNIHKDGSVLGAVFKIVFLLALCGRVDWGAGTVLAIVGVALLEAVVLSAVPSGGLTGEVFICSVMGFPPEMVGIIVVIGTLIDVPATLLNVSGNVTASVVVDALTGRHRGQS